MVGPQQLSVAATEESSAGGTAEEHGTLVLAGEALIAGGWISTTVTVKEQPPETTTRSGELISSSSSSPRTGRVLQFTVVVPTGKNEPDGWSQPTRPQKPLSVGGEYVTSAPHWPAVLLVVIFPGQV